MEFARVLRQLSQRPRLLVLGVLIAAVAAVLSVYSLSGGKLKARSLKYSSATTEVIVDSQASILGNVNQPFEPLAQRAWVYANFMTSPAFLDGVGGQVGLSGAQIYAAGPVNVNEPRVEQEPTDLKRNIELTGETKPYKLSFEAQQNVPTITINSQAPTSSQAVALANAAASGLQGYVANSEASEGIPVHARVVIRQLGPATGGVVDGGIQKELAALVFVGVLLLWCVLMLLGARFRVAWRESAVPALSEEESAEATPAGGRAAAGPGAARGAHGAHGAQAAEETQARGSNGTVERDAEGGGGGRDSRDEERVVAGRTGSIQW